ncbi:MAG: hypothetical protein LUC45_00690 [Paraprevotella sp.]|nr:hypothetical protein [Paraprevotella sp.]
MKRSILLPLSLCSFLWAWGQTPDSAPIADTPEALSQKVAKFGTSIPQEKVYLHIDNTCYFVGDTIWYKAYVTRSDRQTLTDLSKILYVELLTPDGYLVERQQLEMPDGTAHGAFKLTDSLYAGYYELRAYTLWMLNFGQREHPHSKWTEKMFYNKSMAKEFFRDYDKLYSRVFPVFDQPKTAGDYTKDMTLRPMRRYFKTPKGKPALDLRFYPEGGELLEGTDGHVAFEANTKEGRHIDVTLSIQDKNGHEVVRTQTAGRGRGAFTLPSIPKGDRYKAVFQYEGYDYAVNLPEPTQEGCALHVTQTADSVCVALSCTGMEAPALGLQVQHDGVSKAFREIRFDRNGECTVKLPSSQLPTGVNQFTLFDGQGRIYADRLIFVNHHDYDRPRLSVTGVKPQYDPFEQITLQLQLTDTAAATPHLSLSVRDHATDELTYDNGSLLTEMLLGSELKGFVENPGYYFEADDSLHRQALDLLMMIQGWRRYSWKIMSGTEPFALTHFPEDVQTLSGCVNKIEDFRLAFGGDVKEENWLPGQGTIRYPDRDIERDPTIEKKIEEAEKQNSLDPSGQTPNDASSSHDPLNQLMHDNQRYPFSYGSVLSNLKKEVNVWGTYIQGTQTLSLKQTTEKGTFDMQTPLLYGQYILFLPAADLDKGEDYIKEKMRKDFTNEEPIPDYFVKLNRFNPLFPQPYNYYQDAPRYDDDERFDGDAGTTSFTNRQLNTITVRTKRGGLRKLDLTKPALVVDAYDAFNLGADYGMNTGTHNWVTFPQQVALTYIGDMGMDREFFLQIRYDGKPINLKSNLKRVAPQRMNNGTILEVPPVIAAGGEGKMEVYRHLRNLDKLYIYTDYAPREQGSEKYTQDNQPDVVIDYHRFPNEGYQPTYRDRRYILSGYAVCDDFYSPDYSQKPLPDTKDYRRTLYWTPEVNFTPDGKATVKLYNNSKPSVVSIDAEGMTSDGAPVIWKQEN